MDKNTPATAKNTQAFYVQSVIAFSVALLGIAWAVVFLPLDPWARAFLAMTSLFLVSSTFTLAKVVRDNQENQAVHHRIDQARIDRLLAEHDPFKQVA
ncbi:hypothetical protein IEQ44_14155 [Nocardioides sp. Y6]|uniref:YiaAB two helix domain-containing protein n=1 Tax=Nocardioides malaquae TaxID=2773426 RepID=A0ABR9RW24_9ACTN|nr:YiaA/YiaB family inner membrane protein [Nocardioides malaquae]MBE7325792.1 hypothetical protein [Nocardioides malaquae]